MTEICIICATDLDKDQDTFCSEECFIKHVGVSNCDCGNCIECGEIQLDCGCMGECWC